VQDILSRPLENAMVQMNIKIMFLTFNYLPYKITQLANKNQFYHNNIHKYAVISMYCVFLKLKESIKHKKQKFHE
jgi:hypothetical protein